MTKYEEEVEKILRRKEYADIRKSKREIDKLSMHLFAIGLIIVAVKILSNGYTNSHSRGPWYTWSYSVLWRYWRRRLHRRIKIWLNTKESSESR